MEEIDIIELLKRVKEGKAPKEIEINGNKYNYTEECDEEYRNIRYIYSNGCGYTILSENIWFDTKIKILDKPIIEEIDERYMSLPEVYQKINEIIRIINNKE